MKAYHFALLRYRQNAISGEFVNIGVVMWLPKEKQLFHQLNPRYSRLSRLFQNAFEGEVYRAAVRHLMSRFNEVTSKLSGSIQRDLLRDSPEALNLILKTLVSDSDSPFQWSPIMSGLHDHPQVRLNELFEEYVLRHEERHERVRRDEEHILDVIQSTLKTRRLAERIESGVEIHGEQDYTWTFKHGWNNGTRQVLEPISFDYEHPTTILDKAVHWKGRLVALSRRAKFSMTGVVAPPPHDKLIATYKRALAILEGAPAVRKLVPEEKLDTFMPEIERDLKAHSG